jgi:hypothetical protein
VTAVDSGACSYLGGSRAQAKDLAAATPAGVVPDWHAVHCQCESSRLAHCWLHTAGVAGSRPTRFFCIGVQQCSVCGYSRVTAAIQLC